MLCFSPTQPLLFVSLRRGALRDQTKKRTLLRNEPVGTLGQIYFFDENSAQKETMKSFIVYRRERLENRAARNYSQRTAY